MARFYADEDFPYPVVEALRRRRRWEGRQGVISRDTLIGRRTAVWP